MNIRTLCSLRHRPELAEPAFKSLHPAPAVRRIAALFALLAASVLAGCGNPYALKIGKIDYGQDQAPGVIQFTDPKIYKREALINERRDETAYLKALLDNSGEVKFEAQIVREVELIQALSASVGLKFDTGAKLDFERAREISDVQQRIQMTRLEMQLAQLERDAELLRDQLAAQETPSAPAPTGDAGAEDLPSGPDSPDVSNLLDQINGLRDFLEQRLDKVSTPPSKSAGTASPIDEFHDREAYRDAIKSAINAQSLDELHDMNGSTLFRVQLQATVLPAPGEHIDTLGLLRMEIVPPTIDKQSGTLQRLYQRWIWHVMQALNRPPWDASKDNARFEQDQLLLGLGEIGGLFQVVMLEVEKRQRDSSDTSRRCQGWQTEERDNEKCWYLRIPVASGTGKSVGPLFDMVAQFSKTQQNDIRALTEKLSSTDTRRAISEQKLEWEAARKDLSDQQRTKGEECWAEGVSDSTLAFARDVQTFWPALEQSLLFVANSDLGDSELEAQIRQEVNVIINRGGGLRQASSGLLQSLARLEATDSCRAQLVAPWAVEISAAFEKAVTGTLAAIGEAGNRVSVYDVSPTERVHRVSTAARAADAVAMAASLAGTLPSAGLAGSGNFAYTRSASGKADALERAPLVVAFAEPGVTKVHWEQSAGKGSREAKKHSENTRLPAFGWILGPKVALDPENQALVLEHYLAPYELQADLTMPGWWPYFELEVYSAWAPNWRNASAGARSFTPSDSRLERTVRVPLRHNAADMEGLTQVLLEATTGRPIEQPRITDVYPRTLTACEGEITVAIEGDGIWRASEIHIGGFRIPASGIRVLPDMAGVSVTVNSTGLPIVNRLGTQVVVWTHNGKAIRDVKFVFSKDAKACASKPPPHPKGKPLITRVLPSSISACDSDLVFTVEGKHLDKASATLGTMQATSVLPAGPKDGTVVEVKVQVSDRFREIGGLGKLGLVMRTDKGVAKAEVTVTPSAACDKVNPPGPPAAPKPTGPRISKVLPKAISICDNNPQFMIYGKELDGVSDVMFGTITASVAYNNPTPSAESFRIQVVDPALRSKLIGLRKVDLVVRTPKGSAISEVSIESGNCPKGSE